MRRGTGADLERVAEIRLHSWSETYASLIPPDILRPLLDRATQLTSLREAVAEPDALFLVAGNRQGVIVGFALTFLARLPDPLLESLHVARDVQGQGVGTLLMHATAAEIRTRGYSTMQLKVIAGNTAAERFYERLGGVAAGVEPVSWASGVWHHVYRWPNIDVLA